MISFNRDDTTSSSQRSKITCEPDHRIPTVPHPASWHARFSPHTACECLAAMAAALEGSGVKAKASLSLDKRARQDISAETQPKPLDKSLMCIFFSPLACSALDSRQEEIFFSFSACLSTSSDEIPAYLGQTRILTEKPREIKELAFLERMRIPRHL